MLKGPYPIICRGHSGSRLLAEAFRRNGIWMGRAENAQRDAEEFRQKNPVVQDLVRKGFAYSHLAEKEKLEAQQSLRLLVNQLLANCPDPAQYIAFGWKRAISTFMLPVILDTYPQARVVHLIRDGRDVMLSRLNSRMRNLEDPLNRLVVFGDEQQTRYRGRPLERKTIKLYRLELEMLHWRTVVEFARQHGQKHPDRYLEVRYEDLCREPVPTLEKVFSFLQLPVRPEVLNWAASHASPARIGKWKSFPDQFQEAIQLGAPLLKELGYL